MKVGSKLAWLAVVVVGVVVGSGAVLLRQPLVVRPALFPLALVLVQLAALVLPLDRSREPRVDAGRGGEGETRGPARER